MKRNWQVKVIGLPPFSMILMEDGEDVWHVCWSIFQDRLEWIR